MNTPTHLQSFRITLVCIGLLVLTGGLAFAGEVSLLPPGEVPAGAWRYSEGAEFPGAAGSIQTNQDGSLELHYDFTGGGNYVGVYCNLTPSRSIARVSFRMKKPVDAEISIRVTDSTDQTFQKGVLYSNNEWQRLSFDLQTGRPIGADLTTGRYGNRSNRLRFSSRTNT